MGGDDGQDHSNNCRIYFSGMPTDTTEDEVRELFSGIGVIGRIRQKRGYKDQVGPCPPPTNSHQIKYLNQRPSVVVLPLGCCCARGAGRLTVAPTEKSAVATLTPGHRCPLANTHPTRTVGWCSGHGPSRCTRTTRASSRATVPSPMRTPRRPTQRQTSSTVLTRMVLFAAPLMCSVP